MNQDYNHSFFVADCSSQTEQYYEVADTMAKIIEAMRGYDEQYAVFEFHPIEMWSRDVSADVALEWLRLDTERYGKVRSHDIPNFVMNHLPTDELENYTCGRPWTGLPKVVKPDVRNTALDTMAKLGSAHEAMTISFFLSDYEPAAAQYHFDNAIEKVQEANVILQQAGVKILGVANQVTPTNEDSDNDNEAN